MVIELVLNFKGEYADGEVAGESSFTHTLTSPDGFEITGGQIFVENANNSNLQRFSFRIDRDAEGRASLNIIENPS